MARRRARQAGRRHRTPRPLPAAQADHTGPTMQAGFAEAERLHSERMTAPSYRVRSAGRAASRGLGRSRGGCTRGPWRAHRRTPGRIHGQAKIALGQVSPLGPF
ncbi:hypothetical protein HMPREF0043_01334 [Actinobaculum sp. oral taxon 183 str. F0552]|nr:hypothetical protein HMPREF0043_01334 [Actinobaculum sp. oral taxon 183 str. F0552]